MSEPAAPVAGSVIRALLLALLLGAQLAPPARAREWTVRPGQSVAQAVAQAQAGDTIIIERGLYQEHLRVDKPLTLLGRDRPMLSGGNRGDVIRVTAPDVRIEGLLVASSGSDLTAQNAGIYIQPGADRATVRNCEISYSLFGLWIEGVKDVLVENNLITGKRNLSSAQRGNGIQLYHTTGARILGNEVSFVRDGLYVDVSHHALFSRNRIHDVRYGTHYMNSYYNTWEYNDSYDNRGGLALMEVRHIVVRHNRAWNNADHGIMLRTIEDSVIENNIVAGNGRGLFIYDAEYNTIRANLVVANAVGAHISAGSVRNKVDANDFIDNREQIRFIATRDETWGAEQGNYWSNYLGWDLDGNGVGDIPYEASDVMDRLSWRYPAMKLLMNSPAVHTLRLISRQFPLLRTPSIVDPRPRMQAYHTDWRNWRERTRR